MYSAEQVSAFYDRIDLPDRYRHQPHQKSDLSRILKSPEGSYDFLYAIMRYTLASVPFENLSLHYSPHHSVNISPAYLFEKIVASDRNRGGYCMENNTLLLNILLSLGFDVYGAGARINESVMSDDRIKPRRDLKYSGWSHMVLLVRLPVDDNENGTDLFLFDVGFGAGGPTKPIRLRHKRQIENVPGCDKAEEQIVRLNKETLAQTTRGRGPTNEVWVYERQVRQSAAVHGNNSVLDQEDDDDVDESFRPFYSFTEMEFFPEDFAVLNLWPSTSRRSWFTQQAVCLRKIMSEDGSRVVGDTIMWGPSLKKRKYGKEEMSEPLKSENDRINALSQHFGIHLNDSEREGIKGLGSMLRG